MAYAISFHTDSAERVTTFTLPSFGSFFALALLLLAAFPGRSALAQDAVWMHQHRIGMAAYRPSDLCSAKVAFLRAVEAAELRAAERVVSQSSGLAHEAR